MTLNTLKILLPTVFSFIIGITLAPILLKILIQNKLWKTKSVDKGLDGKEATITRKLHNDEEKKVPRLGGSVIWISVLITTFCFWLLPKLSIGFPEKIDFFSRNQTWLLLFVLTFSGILGALDDISSCGKDLPLIKDKGLSFKFRLLVIFLLSLVIGYWFFYKLGFTYIFIPFLGTFYVGIAIIAIISFFTVMMFSTSNIDGIDGLSGGLFAIAFGSYGIIALHQYQIDIATFCFVIVGATMAFLWFNIKPAKFYNSETGMLSLSMSLVVIAILTNQLFSLFIIALPLLTAPASAIIQIFWKKFFGKKFFIVAPVHHHFQALGMDSNSIVLRYWIFGLLCSFLGISISVASSF